MIMEMMTMILTVSCQFAVPTEIRSEAEPGGNVYFDDISCSRIEDQKNDPSGQLRFGI